MCKIYDCFIFFNELELLELRFEILNDYVDKFVLIESTTTFSGKNKDLFFEKNKSKFKKFEDKIIHIIVDNTPFDFFNLPFLDDPKTKKDITLNKILNHTKESKGWNRNEKQWGRETFQRECISLGLLQCNDDDIILISDLDEIPNPKILNEYKSQDKNQIYELLHKTYYYYINLLKEENWSGTKICRYEKIKDLSINLLRQNKFTTKTIPNAGWHFSFMGGIDRIITKIQSYSHQEFNNLYIISNIENNILTENDPFFRGKLLKVDIDDSYPNFIINNIDKFSHMIK
jgi:beta-1,4-mannosyl-glycoprotein beta-1,4-N-acetylglucosaminyltransferase